MYSNKFSTLDNIKKANVSNALLTLAIRIKNEGNHLKELLQSIYCQSLYDNTEIIFLDSGSTDNTFEILSTVNCSIYTIKPAEFTFGDTCNLMLELASTDIVFFLSGHVILESNTCLEMAYNLISKHTNSAAYFRQIPNSMTGSNYYERAFLQRRFPHGKEDVILRGKNSFSNAASVINRSSWLDNKFDNVIASEDFLWAQRHIKLRRPLFYFSSINVMHSHDESPSAVRHRVRINKIARYGTKLQFFKSIYFFLGIFIIVLLQSWSFKESFVYAKAHSLAYLLD